MNFENEQPEKSKALFLVEFIATTFLVLVVIYVSCMEVGATSVSDGNASLVSAFEKKDGFFICPISDTQCAYVPEGYVYWIVFKRSNGYYIAVDNSPLYIHLDKSYIYNTGSSITWYKATGDFYKTFTTAAQSDDGHFYNSVCNYVSIVGGNYITCSADSEITTTPAPEVTDSPIETSGPDVTPFPTSSLSPTVSSGDADDGYTLWTKPLDNYTVSEGLLLILVLCAVGLCISKIIGGVLNCKHLYKK